MFQFTGCPPDDLWIQSPVTEVFPPPGCPIRKSPDQSSIAAPRGVSPLTASFIGPLPQGIHRAPFVAWTTHDKEDRAPRHTGRHARRNAHAAQSPTTSMRGACPPNPKERETAPWSPRTIVAHHPETTLCGCQIANGRTPIGNGTAEGLKAMEDGGIEPPTYGVQNRRSPS